MDTLATKARTEREEELEEAAQRVRHHLVVLELQGKSGNKAEWSVIYDREIERDRLCDWLIWQDDRFLDHAEKHEGEALTRLLVNEMVVTERRAKKEGRGAGGMRLLRMCKGD